LRAAELLPAHARNRLASEFFPFSTSAMNLVAISREESYGLTEKDYVFMQMSFDLCVVRMIEGELKSFPTSVQKRVTAMKDRHFLRRHRAGAGTSA
jgi:hypothetical protein